MEQRLTDLINTLSFKEIQSIEISDICDDNGDIIQDFVEPFIFKENTTYQLSLLSFTTSSFFPNITEKNNKFYYSEPSSVEIKEIEFGKGAYEIKEYAESLAIHLNSKKEDPNIELSLIEPIGKVLIKLKPGFKVYFNKPNTWYKELGFKDTDILDKTINIASNMANILSVQRIYIHCDLVRGSVYKGKHSTIIYSFSNNYSWGDIVNLKINPIQATTLINKNFNQLRISFRDSDDNPVTFMKSLVSLKLEIRQV